MEKNGFKIFSTTCADPRYVLSMEKELWVMATDIDAKRVLSVFHTQGGKAIESVPEMNLKNLNR